MSKTDSMGAIQDAIHSAAEGNDHFYGKRNVVVSHLNDEYVYKNVIVSAFYVPSYGQMTVCVEWDDDKTQPPVKELALYKEYNTNYQEFSFDNGYLRWSDCEKVNRISIDFSKEEL